MKKKVEKNLRESSEIDDSTKLAFESEWAKTNLSQVIEYKLIHSPMKVNRQKEFWKIHVSPQVFLENTEVEGVIIELNEEVFIRVDPESQVIIMEKIVAGIGYDFEKGKILKNRPDVIEFSLMVKKHGHERLEAIGLSIDSIIEKMKEEGIM
jgi:hypothetical protein